MVDAPIWAHARPDLADLRLYEGNAQLAYALSEELGASSTAEREARILNLGVRDTHTEFDLDIGGEFEYNRVQLRLNATNFVASATAYGRDAIHAGDRRNLSTSTLYDFSRDGLGNNFALRVPTSTFRYLHVTITPTIAPDQIVGATTSSQREVQATWLPAGKCHSSEQVGRTTRFACDLEPGVPVGRIVFTLSPKIVNFRRGVRVMAPKGEQICSGSISRIRRKSSETEVLTENLALGFCSASERHIVIEVDNGDDPPLDWEIVEPQTLERRIYFDPAGKSGLKLYYGDEKLGPPEYDYAKFFHKDAEAVQASLGAEMQNPEYTGRPDERPWSERNQWILWGAMLLAVAVLAGFAVKGLASSGPTQK